MEFYSHKNKKLIDHLIEVENLSIKSVDAKYIKAEKIISCCHDFGKYTTYFQKYLFSGEKSRYANHGFISALFAAYCMFNIIGEDNYLPLIAYSCVLHHHGSLENLSNDLPKNNSGLSINDNVNLVEKIDIALVQAEDMRKNIVTIENEYEILGLKDEVSTFLNTDCTNDILSRLKKMQFKLIFFNKDEKIYFLHQMLYSALISSDKISASDTIIPEVKYGNYKDLLYIKSNKFNNTSKINSTRDEIFNNVQKNIEEHYLDSKIFSITAPTGTGKTYTGFFAAMKLNELLGSNRKIIYSLPFTSIIDQNFDSIKDLYNNIPDFNKNMSEYIIKHHNLSDVEYSSEYENYDRMAAEMLIENWNSGIIVTTFVQLIETLIGSRNRMLKKFNSIRGSIIILDEIQAIDSEYYMLIDKVLKDAALYLDCRIIMMTATKPIILESAVELLDGYEKYFSIFNRTRLIPLNEKIFINKFIKNLKDNLENKSYLIICNTIGQSISVYNEVKKFGRETLYLSTNLLPVDRKEKIKYIREKLKNNEKIIVVSTQVVEAGVDFDFDIVIRDIAPLDSIIQSAGRCNRNWREKTGKVYITSMVDDKGYLYSNYVYSKNMVNITLQLISGFNIIEEKDFLSLIKNYYIEVKEKKSMDISKSFLESIRKLNFGGTDDCFTLSRFSLIKNNPGYIDVFLRVNNEAEEIYQKLLQIIGEKDYMKKRAAYLEIRNKIKDYTLSLPIKYKDKFNDFIILNMTEEACDDYYDKKSIGFIREDKESFLMF